MDILKKAKAMGYKIILTTDHGTIRVKNPLKVIGDKTVNTNIRYKVGRNLDYDRKKVYDIHSPEKIGLPALHISSKYIFATGDDFFAYPNNYNYYAVLLHRYISAWGYFARRNDCSFYYFDRQITENLFSKIYLCNQKVHRKIILNMNIKIESLDKIDEAALEFIRAMGDNTVFAFHGDMGAGKTTFIKAICENLGYLIPSTALRLLS
jgi:Predicted ATPase or kinase